MRSVFLDFGTVSHDDLDTTQLERVLPGITLYPTSTDAEVDERIAGVRVHPHQQAEHLARAHARRARAALHRTHRHRHQQRRSRSRARARHRGLQHPRLLHRVRGAARARRDPRCSRIACANTARPRSTAPGRAPNSSRCPAHRSASSRARCSASWVTARSDRRWPRPRATRSACACWSPSARARRRREADRRRFAGARHAR